MQFYSQIENEIIKTTKPLAQLNGFYVASATVCNKTIIDYHCNDAEWVQQFLKNWQNDPIVSSTPLINNKLAVNGWNLGITSPEHAQYCEFRYEITGAANGFTATRSLMSTQGIISEFYAIAATDKNSFSNQQISDSLFVKKALSLIFNAFSRS